MRLLLSIILTATCALFINSCQEGDDDLGVNQEQEQEDEQGDEGDDDELLDDVIPNQGDAVGLVKSISFSLSDELYIIEGSYNLSYDDTNRVSELEYSYYYYAQDLALLGDDDEAVGEYIATLSYDYSDNDILLTLISEKYIDYIPISKTRSTKSVALNSKGFPMQRESVSDATNYLITSLFEYEYSSDDYISSFRYTYSYSQDEGDDVVASDTVEEYTWRGGNLLYLSYDTTQSGGYVAREISYGDDINTLNVDLSYLLGVAEYAYDTTIPHRSLYGNSTYNLPTKVTYSLTGVTYGYDYTYNSDGALITIDMSYNSEPYRTYNISYY